MANPSILSPGSALAGMDKLANWRANGSPGRVLGRAGGDGAGKSPAGREADDKLTNLGLDCGAGRSR